MVDSFMRNICVLLILCVCCHALQVLHPPSLAGHYNSYPIPNYSTIKPVTSILTVLSPIDACTIDQVANKNELNGTITIADPSTISSNQDSDCKVVDAI